jgi:hypothetical protein
MAGEWIKVRTNLWSDPRVSKLCDLTGMAEATIVGGLYWLWATADEHTETGHMPGLSITGIDRKTGIKGFGAALIEIEWITDTLGGITLNRFDEHNGASAKNRVTTAKRVAKHAAKAKVDATANAQQTPVTPITNAPIVSTPLPREEKRREEESQKLPHTPQAGLVRKSSNAIALKSYLEQCKANQCKPIPEDDSVFDYADKVGLSKDFLRLQWLEFKDRYGMDGAKRYKSWPSVFGKSVRGNWFKLWYIGNDNGYALTTVGQQAKRQHGEES